MIFLFIVNIITLYTCIINIYYNYNNNNNNNKNSNSIFQSLTCTKNTNKSENFNQSILYFKYFFLKNAMYKILISALVQPHLVCP